MISRQSYFYLPILIFIFIWMSVFILFQISPLELYRVQEETVFIFIGSIFLVIAGYLYYRFFFLSGEIEFYRIEHKYYVKINEKLLIKILLVLNTIIIISLLFFLINIANERGGILDYLQNPIISRNLVVKTATHEGWDLKLAFSSYGINLLTLSLIVGGILFTSDKISYRVISLSSILLEIVYGLIIFSRNALVYAILIWFFSLLYISYYQDARNRKATINRAVFALLIFVFLFLLLSYIIVSFRFFTLSSQGIYKTFMQQLNYYITGNVVAFDQYLRQEVSLEWGNSLFRSIIKWITRLGLLKDIQVMDPNYEFIAINMGIRANTYSYIRVFYEDFGIVGLSVLSFIWGWIAAKVSRLYIVKFSFIRLYFIVVISFAFFMSFFGFFFINMTKVLYNIIILLVFQRIFQDKILFYKQYERY